MVNLTLTALAVYRLAHAIAVEEGPFEVFEHIRRIDITQSTWVGRGLSCPLCLSFWISLLAAFFFNKQTPFPLRWLGVAGAVLFGHKLLYK